MAAVSIDQINTEISAGPSERGSGGGSASSAAPDEVRIEELRSLIRELLVEELDRYLRLAIDR